MPKLSEKELLKRDAKRDIGEELRRAIQEMKSGKAARVHHVSVPVVTEARVRSGFSQKRFAELLGVSARTLQEWEQGRRRPSGAARSLLTIAIQRPDVLREVFAG